VQLAAQSETEDTLLREARNFYSEEHPDKPMWDYKEQLIKYCWQDVEVLRLGCQAYRRMFTQEEFGWRPNPIDPFLYLTQNQVLQEWALAGTDIKIARIPYKSTGKQSKVALAWLLEKQKKLREWFQPASDTHSILTPR
jgi:hypothetical protein